MLKIKPFFTAFLALLGILAFQPVGADLDLRNPLPQGPIKVKGSKLVIERREVFMYGANYTYDSVDALPPKEFAQDCLKRGENWVRFHKIKSGIDILPYVDALYQVGIRSSVDILLADDAIPFYSGDMSKFNARVSALGPVLKHPGLFLVCMVNEGGHFFFGGLSAGMTDAVSSGRDSLRAAGFTGLIGDLPDAVSNPPLFVDQVKQLDVALGHMYGYHPQGNQYQEPVWQFNTGFSGVSYWLRDLTGKPLLFQELGCLFPDSRRHINEAYHAWECLQKGASGLCMFQWASNHDQMLGKATQVDMFSIATDPLRQVSFIAGALFAKSKVPSSNAWTYDYKLGPFGGSIAFSRAKQRVVLLFGRSSVDGFKSHDVGQGWLQIDAYGSRKMWHPEGDWYDVGAPIASAKRVDTFSLKSLEDLPVDGTKFLPPREVGVFEVWLK